MRAIENHFQNFSYFSEGEKKKFLAAKFSFHWVIYFDDILIGNQISTFKSQEEDETLQKTIEPHQTALHYAPRILRIKLIN